MTEMWSSFSISRACIAAEVNYGLIFSRVQRQLDWRAGRDVNYRRTALPPTTTCA
jgi:hypothetical protein